jgi:hypothetical protein
MTFLRRAWALVPRIFWTRSECERLAAEFNRVNGDAR